MGYEQAGPCNLWPPWNPDRVQSADAETEIGDGGEMRGWAWGELACRKTSSHQCENEQDRSFKDFFHTLQVRVVRFYRSCSSSPSPSPLPPPTTHHHKASSQIIITDHFHKASSQYVITKHHHKSLSQIIGRRGFTRSSIDRPKSTLS